MFAQKDKEFVNDMTIPNFAAVFDSYKFSTSLGNACFTSDEVSKCFPEPDPDKKFYLSFKPHKITEEEFANLSPKDLFVYAFTYPETYYQSCSMFFMPDTVVQTIPALLKKQGEGLRMSHDNESLLVQIGIARSNI